MRPDNLPLYLADPYLTSRDATLVAATDEGLVLDQPLFYPTGGGQPGDAGRLDWAGGSVTIATTQKSNGTSLLVPAPDQDLPPPGTTVTQQIDWAQRLGHMRVHTALHLLSVVIPLPVTGGAISKAKGRIDFNMATPPEDKTALEDQLNTLIARDLSVDQSWITEAELDANPGLVKTLSVSPPRGAGLVRLVRIGPEDGPIDLQPCGGTHVARTSEIGRVRLGKIEKKGRENRRVYLHLVDETA